MKTIKQIVDEYTARYENEEYQGGELDMVRAALTAALAEDRAVLDARIESLKVGMPETPTEADLVQEHVNDGLRIAQMVLKDTE